MHQRLAGIILPSCYWQFHMETPAVDDHDWRQHQLSMLTTKTPSIIYILRCTGADYRLSIYNPRRSSCKVLLLRIWYWFVLWDSTFWSPSRSICCVGFVVLPSAVRDSSIDSNQSISILLRSFVSTAELIHSVRLRNTDDLVLGPTTPFTSSY